MIQHISGVLDFNSVPDYVLVSGPTQFIGTNSISFFAATVPNGLFTAFEREIQIYLDGGSPISVQTSTDVTFSNTPNVAENLSLTGYLLDCTVVPCAAIAH